MTHNEFMSKARTALAPPLRGRGYKGDAAQGWAPHTVQASSTPIGTRTEIGTIPRFPTQMEHEVEDFGEGLDMPSPAPRTQIATTAKPTQAALVQPSTPNDSGPELTQSEPFQVRPDHSVQFTGGEDGPTVQGTRPPPPIKKVDTDYSQPGEGAEHLGRLVGGALRGGKKSIRTPE